MSFTRKMLVGRKIGCTIAAGCSSRSEFRCILLSRNTQGGSLDITEQLSSFVNIPAFWRYSVVPTCTCMYIGQHSNYITNQLMGIISLHVYVSNSHVWNNHISGNIRIISLIIYWELFPIGLLRYLHLHRHGSPELSGQHQGVNSSFLVQQKIMDYFLWSGGI